MAETWPAELIAGTIDIRLMPRTFSGPATISGRTQVVGADGPIWQVVLSDIQVRYREQILAWRALEARLSGRLGTVLVPLCGWQPNSGRPSVAHILAGAPAVNSVVTTANANARTTSLAVNVAYGGPLEPGVGFSVGERYYRIADVVPGSGGAHTLSVRPYLRDAISSGSVLNFHAPVCRMRLASDNEMQLPLRQRRFGTGSITFIEDV